jgi:O-antigen/teichoic acid export membrane protein
MTPKQLLREGAPLSAAEFGRALYTNGDVLLLGALATTAEAGFFHLSHKVVLTISLASTLMQAAAFPLTSRLYAESPARALNVQRGLLRLGLTVALPAAAFGGLLAADVLQLLFGQGYEGAAPVLALVLWTLPVVAFSGSCRQLLIVSHQADQLLAGVTAGASLHLAAALLLIPEHGALGAAAACLAGEIATALALAVRLRRAIGGIPLDRSSLSPVAATAAASLALALSSGPWLQQVVLASAVYGVSALAFGAVRPRELRSLFR